MRLLVADALVQSTSRGEHPTSAAQIVAPGHCKLRPESNISSSPGKTRTNVLFVNMFGNCTQMLSPIRYMQGEHNSCHLSFLRMHGRVVQSISDSSQSFIGGRVGHFSIAMHRVIKLIA
jgi:hypothetical protein